MDKRDLSGTFRDRLRLLLARTGLSQAAFATSVGIDRSALSQLLSGEATRLPRAETLAALAAEHKVSLDWLLGLSQDEGLTGEIRRVMELEEALGESGHSLLSQWHAEAAGTKIRYVPAGIPDLLRGETLIRYEAEISGELREPEAEAERVRQAQARLSETDMEICMPRHTLEIFSRGLGVWTGLTRAERRAQLGHMASLLDELYPRLRLHLYDGRARYSAPLTIFGAVRAAIYVGDMYLVLNATAPIRALTRHFDHLIRAAEVNPHEAGGFMRTLLQSAN